MLYASSFLLSTCCIIPRHFCFGCKTLLCCYFCVLTCLQLCACEQFGVHSSTVGCQSLACSQYVTALFSALARLSSYSQPSSILLSSSTWHVCSVGSHCVECTQFCGTTELVRRGTTFQQAVAVMSSCFLQQLLRPSLGLHCRAVAGAAHSATQQCSTAVLLIWF